MNKINKFILKGTNFKESDPELVTWKYASWLGIIGIVILSAYSVINYFYGDYFATVFEGLLAITLLGAFIHFRVTKTTDVVINIGLVLIMIMAINNLIGGGFSDTGILWIFSFPPIAYFLTDSKKGTIWMLVYLLIILSFLLVAVFDPSLLHYSAFMLGMLLVTVSIDSLLVYIYQLTIEQSRKTQIKVLADLEIQNRILELGNEIADTEEFLEESLMEIVEYFGFRSGSIHLININSDKSVLAATYKITPQAMALIKEFDVSDATYNDITENGKVLYSTEYEKIDPALARISSTNTVLMIPMIARDRIVGVIAIGAKNIVELENSDIELAKSLASEMAVVLDRIQSDQLLVDSLQQEDK